MNHSHFHAGQRVAKVGLGSAMPLALALFIIPSTISDSFAQPLATVPVTSETDPLSIDSCEMLIRLPDAISNWELDFYQRAFQLSGEQMAALRALQTKNKDAYELVFQKNLPILFAEAAQAAPGNRASDIDAFTLKHSEAFIQLQQKMWRELNKLDSHLFVELRLLLSEKQQEAMPRVQMHRERARSTRMMADRTIPAARIDLSRMTEAMPLSGEERTLLDHTLREYEEAVTSAWVRLDKNVFSDDMDRQNISHDLRYNAEGQRWALDEPTSKARWDQVVADLKQLVEPRARLEQQIVELNQKFFPTIRDALPSPLNEQFEAAYLQTAYPDVHPDPTDPSLFVSIFRDTLAADKTMLELVNATVEPLLREYKVVVNKMMQESMAGIVQFAENFTSKGRNEHMEAMAAFRFERIALTKRTVDQVMALLTPEWQIRLDDEAKQFRQRLDMFEQQAAARLMSEGGR